jgi:hypothetical protein
LAEHRAMMQNWRTILINCGPTASRLDWLPPHLPKLCNKLLRNFVIGDQSLVIRC